MGAAAPYGDRACRHAQHIYIVMIEYARMITKSGNQGDDGFTLDHRDNTRRCKTKRLARNRQPGIMTRILACHDFARADTQTGKTSLSLRPCADGGRTSDTGAALECILLTYSHGDATEAHQPASSLGELRQLRISRLIASRRRNRWMADGHCPRVNDYRLVDRCATEKLRHECTVIVNPAANGGLRTFRNKSEGDTSMISFDPAELAGDSDRRSREDNL
jgi:hypothetical protein